MDSNLRLTRITNLTSLSIAIIILIFVPVGYYITSHSYETQILQEQADITAEALSKQIYTYPDSWEFQTHRLKDIIEQGAWRKPNIHYHVTSNSGEQLVDVGQDPEPPVFNAKTFLTNGATEVGNVTVVRSMRPLLLRTLTAALISAFIAWSVHFTLRVLPFAALNRVMNSLQQSKQHLAKEIEEKEKILVEYRKANDAVSHQALHDMLTGLPNRAHFDLRLKSAIEEHKNLAVMIIDLNRFKEINDTLGHHTGDTVLIHISKRIRGSLPEETVFARLGGDEFSIIIPGAGKTNAETQASRLTQELRPHVVVDEYHLAISASIGISLFPDHGESSQQIMRHADIAMYYAKKSAQPYCFYNHSYDDNSPSRLTLTADLRHAIDSKGLMLHYQPKIDIGSGEVIGVEALSRWQHPDHGYISPDVFIAIAEQAGMINPLTEWVINEALQQLMLWKKSGLDINIAVNISARNLQNENLVPLIYTLLSKHDISPRHLTLEITESSIMVDPVQSMEIIQQLTEHGVRIAVDDFGTGYSSLAYLKKLTVNELKIDRSFVQNMLSDSDDQVIVQSTVELAHNLNLKVVAEGVEDQDALNLLHDYGCDSAQGFYLCKPVSAELFEQWLNSQYSTPYLAGLNP